MILIWASLGAVDCITQHSRIGLFSEVAETS